MRRTGPVKQSRRGRSDDKGSPTAGGPEARLAEEDILRADTYALLGRLLLAPPQADLLAKIATLTGDDSEFGAAVAALGATAKAVSVESVRTEYDALFIGTSRGELQPYASYYLAGGLYRQPLADLRGDMARLGVARHDSVAEPEDHIGALCEIMAGLILGVFAAAPASLAEQRRLFEAHIEPWAADFFADLETAQAAQFYRPVGQIGSQFLAIERGAFDLAS